jgi:sugar phosphate isomerase/epimerase
MAMLPKPMLSISLAGLSPDAAAPWSGGARAAISWAAASGLRCVQLDATTPGLRPRELDRSARRDLGAFLRRSELSFSGLDLWIPPEHFVDPARVSRAVEATKQAAELAADLSRTLDGGGAVVSIVLPHELSAEVLASIADHAIRCGAGVADHRLVPAASPQERERAPERSPIGIGLDPAAALTAGHDPAVLAARAGQRLLAARLTDASLVGRVAPGSAGGRLDEMAYIAALSVAEFKRPLVLDLRGIPNQRAAAAAVLARW